MKRQTYLKIQDVTAKLINRMFHLGYYIYPDDATCKDMLNIVNDSNLLNYKLSDFIFTTTEIPDTCSGRFQGIYETEIFNSSIFVRLHPYPVTDKYTTPQLKRHFTFIISHELFHAVQFNKVKQHSAACMSEPESYACDIVSEMNYNHTKNYKQTEWYSIIRKNKVFSRKEYFELAMELAEYRLDTIKEKYMGKINQYTKRIRNEWNKMKIYQKNLYTMVRSNIL